MTDWFGLGDDEERAVAALMSRVASLPAPSGVQDPARLWWKAQLLKNGMPSGARSVRSA